jgi:hypothetical protein
MGRWMLKLAHALAWLAVVVLVGYYFGMVSMPGSQQTLQDVQVDYLAAIITSDCTVSGEDSEVCEEIGRTALRHSARFSASSKQIFKGGLTLVPVGHKRGLYLRQLWFVKREADSWHASVDTARKVIDEAKGLVPPGCATHYIRAPRRTDSSAQPEKAKQSIRATMTSVGRYKNKGHTEFFCPKE